MVSIYELALTKVYGIGVRIANEILKNISAEDLFSLSKTELQHLFGAKERTINEILSKQMFKRCEQELEFIQRYNIRSYFLTHPDYPYRLKQIPDAPVCLFVDGNGDISPERSVAIVGTRNNTDYGTRMTQQIVEELRKLKVSVFSGLARGIDSISHIASLNCGIPTFGVLAHGLDYIHPRENFDLAQKMKENGALITEYFTKTENFAYNFPHRNRIIAGLSDLVIVVEATKKSGTLITAQCANDYNRDVLAVPNSVENASSEGCNFLIESKRADIYASPKSIAKLMDWDELVESISLFTQEPNPDKSQNLHGNKKKIYQTLKLKGEMDIDTLCVEMQMGANELSATLLELELEDYVIAKPGRIYKAL